MKIALLQSAPAGGVEPAMSALDTLLAEARAEDCDLFVTPEMWIGGYNIAPEDIHATAERAHEIGERLAALAARHKIAIAAGYPTPGSKAPRNCATVFDKTGAQIVQYAKTHLFGELDRARFEAGDSLSPVVALGEFRVALAICYDIEFPELARHLAQSGADLIVVPTANMVPFDSVATRMVPTRAEENEIFVAYANMCGQEGEISYCGQSCIVGPDGADLARAGTGSGLIFAQLDRTQLDAQRKLVSHLADRRTSLYSSN